MPTKNIAVLMGGFSSEFPISLKSGKTVCDHLDPEKYRAFPVKISREGWFCELSDKFEIPINKHDFTVKSNGKIITFDAVFNTIHGTPGENGLIQAYLELLKIPQTTSGFYQSALTFNKRDTISVLRPYGIKTAINFLINKGDEINTEAIVAKVGLPCFVKANKAGSSFGISKVYKEENLKSAIKLSFAEDDEIIIESFLKGTEVSVGVINYKGKVMALPVTEIVSDNDFFDYTAKYEGKSQEITPARITEPQTLAVQKQAETVFKVLKLKGLTRAEFIFHNDEPHFLEVNTTPGLSPASIIPQQAKEAGISLKELFGTMIENTITEVEC